GPRRQHLNVIWHRPTVFGLNLRRLGSVGSARRPRRGSHPRSTAVRIRWSLGFRRRAHPFLHSHRSAVSRPARAAARQLAPWGRPPDPNTGRPSVSGFSLRRLWSRRSPSRREPFPSHPRSGVLEAPDDATPRCATPTPSSALVAHQVGEP